MQPHGFLALCLWQCCKLMQPDSERTAAALALTCRPVVSSLLLPPPGPLSATSMNCFYPTCMQAQLHITADSHRSCQQGEGPVGQSRGVKLCGRGGLDTGQFQAGMWEGGTGASQSEGGE